MTKLLMVGFSCTDTSDGYAEYLVEKLRITEPGISVRRCALGGMAPPIVPAALKTMLQDEPDVSHVLFEVSTSIYAWLEDTTVEKALDVIRDMIATALDHGVPPVFLMLHREEDRPRQIDFDDLLRQECRDADIQYIDLATNMEQLFGRGWFERQYRDPVHTNEAGGRSQASFALPTVRQFLLRPIDNIKFNRRPRRTLNVASISDLSGVAAAENFKRKDYQRPFVKLEEVGRIDIEFEKPLEVLGVTFAIGPWSGNFTMHVASDSGIQTVHAQAYDERAYYSRLGFRALNGYDGATVGRISFTFRDRALDMQQIKGERDPFPCHIRLIDLLYFE